MIIEHVLQQEKVLNDFLCLFFSSFYSWLRFRVFFVVVHELILEMRFLVNLFLDFNLLFCLFSLLMFKRKSMLISSMSLRALFIGHSKIGDISEKKMFVRFQISKNSLQRLPKVRALDRTVIKLGMSMTSYRNSNFIFRISYTSKFIRSLEMFNGLNGNFRKTIRLNGLTIFDQLDVFHKVTHYKRTHSAFLEVKLLLIRFCF